MNKKERFDLAHWAVDRALKAGADQAAVGLNFARRIEVEFRDKKLDKLQEATENGLYLQVYVQQRYSGQSTNDLKRESLERFIQDAVASTKYLTKDEFRSLPDPKYYPSPSQRQLKLLDESYPKIETSERVKMASAIEAAAMAQSDQIISTTAGYNDSHSEEVRVHSNGFEGAEESTVFSAGAEVTVKDGESGRPEDWFYATTRFRNELLDPETLGKNAAQRALRKIGQKKLESGRYVMVVENRAGRQLLRAMGEPLSGRALQQKSSFLEGMIGKKIASEKLTVIDDPFVEKGLGSRFFDGEGLAAQRRVFIERGVLRHYSVDDYYGKKLGMEPTSGDPSNILLEYGTRSLEEMIAGVKRGILVTDFIGGNSNSTTGDFSFGIVGLLIEDGKTVRPVNEMNISGNLKELWNQLTDVGNDPYPYSSVRMPSVRFEEVDFSGL
ncbi:MAG: modulator protein [Bacteroidetes bacterium]|nr:modulator protein [Bacteroidota bacterium]